MSIKIDFSALKKSIRSHVVKNDFPILLREATNASLPKLRKEFARIYKSTDFSRGLRGQYPDDWERDVQAILGFYPFEVDDIDDKIASILGESIRFTKFIVRNDAVYFQVTSQNLKDFLAAEYPNGSYTSSGGGNVDWLNWILYGGSVDADLIFKSTLTRDSKSGRALMLNVGKGQWDAEEHDVFPSSDSGGFIKELLNSEEFAEIAQKTIADNFRKVVG